MKYIILMGSPITKFEGIGPFDSFDDAASYGVANLPDKTWWPLELSQPDDPSVATAAELLPDNKILKLPVGI